jgi:hypothetical protein
VYIPLYLKYFRGGFFIFFVLSICRSSDSTVSTVAGIEPRTVATGSLALTTRLDLILHTSEGGWGLLVVSPVGGGEEGVAGADGAVTSRQQAGIRPARPVPPSPKVKGTKNIKLDDRNVRRRLR